MAHKVLIDTDPGIDDAMAILYALSDPGIELVGLTTVFGNVPVETATRNALDLMALAGSDAAVAEGAALPRTQPLKPHPDFVHGAGGFGDARLPRASADAHALDAADFIIQALHDAPGEVTLISVGPLTNLAEALDRAPEIAGLVREVVIMGGAFACAGNVSPVAEANIWNDPHAADLVFAADWPMRMIGLDVTEQVRCAPEDFARLADARPVTGGFLAKAAAFYMDFHRESAGFYGCYMHDPSAVISAVRPALFRTEPHPLTAICDGEEIGATRTVTGRRPVDVALAVEAEAVRQHFLDVIASGPLR
ncbi:MAG: nucleoside hydrolase [Pseudomonadota bacterium]